MGRIGEALRRAREEKGITLRQAEEATKIRLKYLDALEREEFGQLPGRVYALGFLRTYAQYLGLDGKELVEELKALWPPEEDSRPVAPSPVREKETKKGFLTRWLGILLVLVLLWGVNQVYNRYHSSLRAPVSSPQEGQKVEEVATAPDNPQPSPPPPSMVKVAGVEVKIYIKERECWISVKADGREVFAGTLKGGESRNFKGEHEITLTLGNAGVAEVTVNGEILPPLGRAGEVVTRTFKAQQTTGETKGTAP